MPTYKVSFSTDSWKEDKETFGDLEISHVRTDRTLTGGGVEGKAVAMYIMTYFGPKTKSGKGCVIQNASFDGEMVFTGTVDGKKGSFALRSTGIYTGDVDNKWTVVEGTGTGEFKNVKGTGSYFIPQGHSCPNDAVLELEI